MRIFDKLFGKTKKEEGKSENVVTPNDTSEESILGNGDIVEQRKQQRRDKEYIAYVDGAKLLPGVGEDVQWLEYHVEGVGEDVQWLEWLEYQVNGAKSKREKRDALYNLGNNLARKGNYNEALSKYKKATKIDPYDAYSYFNIAFCYYKLGQKGEALAYYEKCFQNCGDLTTTTLDEYGFEHGQGFALDTINEISVVLSELGRIDEAIKWLNKAIEINPRYYLAYRNKAVYLYNSGKYNEALINAEKCIELGDPQGDKLKTIIAKKLNL
jgi:tetratricopeptide (TPR) repeat protein